MSPMATESIFGAAGLAHCANCPVSCACCTGETEPAFLAGRDLEDIKKRYPKAVASLGERRAENTGTSAIIIPRADGRCAFLSGSRCEIYEIRPLDCRLFPLDIYKKDGRYFWLIYSDFCPLSSLDDMDAKLDKAERWLLARFGETELEQYATYHDSQRFKDGRWIELREVNMTAPRA